MGQKRNMQEGWVTDTFEVCVQGIPPDNAVSKINVDYRKSHSSAQAGFIIRINF